MKDATIIAGNIDQRLHFYSRNNNERHQYYERHHYYSREY